MHTKRRFWTTVLTIALLQTAGCGGCFKPPGDRADTPRGGRLQLMYDENRSVAVETSAKSPVRFDPITVIAEKKGEEVYYSPVLTWRVADGQPALRVWLEERIRKLDRERESGEVLDCKVRLGYLDEAGAVVDSEEVTLPVTGSPAPIHLKAFAQTAAPARATAALVSATWVLPEFQAEFLQAQPSEARATGGKLALRAPLGLPIRFDDIAVSPPDAKGGSPSTPRWQLVGDRAALRTLLERLTVQGPRTAGREPKTLTLLLTYKDRRDQPVGTEKLSLDLSSGSGFLRLGRLGKSDIQSISVVPVSVTWREERTVVPLQE